MQKIVAFIAFLLLAVLASGAFGALHDQISYTVSSEYFTRFKFAQFNLLDADIPERIRAAQVGFLASWSMGIPLGLLTGVAGFIHPRAVHMRKALLLSLALMAGITLICALTGLAAGFFKTTALDLSYYTGTGWFVPEGLEQPRRFICAGYMHNAAYLGSVLAVPFAWMFHFRYRHRVAHAVQRA